MHNPFNPSFGKIPPVLLGRKEIREDYEEELENPNIPLLRSPRIGLSALSPFEIKLAYEKVFAKSAIELSDEVASQMTKMTKGYSYAFQLLGYLAWKKGRKTGKVTFEILNDLLPTYITNLEKNSYSKIYQELSEKDREFLKIMASTKQRAVSVTEIRNKLGKSSGYISMYRRRLLDAQVIEVSGYGKVTFTLPYFGEFINEMEKFEMD